MDPCICVTESLHCPRETITTLLIALCPTPCSSMDCGLQAPLSVQLSRQEYWSGLPCRPPGDLPDPGIEPSSLTSPALAGGFSTTSAANTK